MEKKKADMCSVMGLVTFRIFPPHMGGQKGVALFYAYLQRHLRVFLAVSKDNSDDPRTDMEPLLFSNRSMWRNIFRKKDLEQIIRKKNIDILMAEHSYAGWLAWLVSRAMNRPFIIHSHNIESRRFRQMRRWWWRLYHWYEGWIHRKATHNFFISEEEKDLALDQFGLQPSRCSVITYGIERRATRAKEEVRKTLGLDLQKTIFLFNGTLDYQPNYEAVVSLLQSIEPGLRHRLPDYEILITGNRTPKELIKKMLENPNVQYLGYVEDIQLYYQAADLFLNPVCNDTGVKTKLIESIANHCTAVSAESGAIGIKKEVCGNKLVTAPDGDWNSFVDQIMRCRNETHEKTPEEFYGYYDWDQIAARAASVIRTLVHP